MKNRPRVLVVALTGLLAVSSCHGDRRAEKAMEGGAGEPEVLPATAGQVLEAVREPGALAVLVNVWATWCAPCKEEFPDLVRLHREYRSRGLRLIFVSGDFDSELPAVARFLSDHGVDFPSYIKVGDDMTFINALEPRWSGAMPATFVYDGTGALRDFWEGKASYETLEKTVLRVLEDR